MIENNFFEKKIELENGVVGILNSSESENLPIVLMFHGFASDKNEAGNLFKIVSDKLAEKNIASLRIDFFGWGESKGKSSDSNIDSMLNDAQLAYSYILNTKNIDKSNIFILGFSLGGGISLLFSEKNQNIKSVVLWSSVFDLKRNFLDSLGKEVFDRAETQEILEIDLGWKTVTLSREFFKSLERYDIYQAIKNYQGDILSIIGTEDPLHRNNDIFKEVISNSPDNKMIFIEGADHIFNVFESNIYSNIVIKETVKWFEKCIFSEK